MYPDPTFEPPETFQIAHPLQRVQIGPTKKIWIDPAVSCIASQHHARCPRRATNHSQIRHHACRSTQSIGRFGGVQFIGKTRPTPGCPTAFARYVIARHEICTQLARPIGLRRKCQRTKTDSALLGAKCGRRGKTKNGTCKRCSFTQ